MRQVAADTSTDNLSNARFRKSAGMRMTNRARTSDWNISPTMPWRLSGDSVGRVIGPVRWPRPTEMLCSSGGHCADGKLRDSTVSLGPLYYGQCYGFRIRLATIASTAVVHDTASVAYSRKPLGVCGSLRSYPAASRELQAEGQVDRHLPFANPAEWTGSNPITGISNGSYGPRKGCGRRLREGSD